jgi:hypothetical protein
MRASKTRFVLATLVAWVAATVADFIFNALFLGTDFKATQGYWRPVAELRALVPVGRLAFLVTVVCYGLVVRNLLKEVSLRSGVILGGLLAASSFAGVSLGIYSLVAWPPKVLIVWGIQGALNALLTCSIFGAMCQVPRDRAPATALGA